MRRHLWWVLFACVAGRAHGAEIEPMVKLTHGSDLFRGCPQNCREYEPLYDSLTIGATITAGKHRRWELDLSHGVKQIDRGPAEGSSEFVVRYYPRRKS